MDLSEKTPFPKDTSFLIRPQSSERMTFARNYAQKAKAQFEQKSSNDVILERFKVSSNALDRGRSLNKFL